MKKHLMAMLVLLVAVAVAMPAFAGVDFKYGGQFRARWVSNDNFDGVDDRDDNRNYFDQRLRLYFYFVASENLRVVTRFEVGDTTWGKDDSRLGAGTGGDVGADAVNVETKNAYVEFGIPTTPVKASVGIQGIALLDSWIIDDDFSAITAKAKFDPITVQAGYIAGQNNNVTDETENIDSWFLSLDYNQGPFSATLTGYYQDGHDTNVSTDISKLASPFSAAFPTSVGATRFDDNQFFDLGLRVAYKIDWLSAYVNFVKNLGSVDANTTAGPFVIHDSADYTGWMVDGGVSYFCGPFTANIGGFYTTGQDLNDNGNDIDFFTYPIATTKYFSEIMGGGVLDRDTPIAHTSANGTADFQWNAYGQPTNLWTVTVGGSWQALEKTKLSASYWYFGSSEDVVSGTNALGFEKLDNSIGHEFDFYLTQGIVDGLTLDLVGAYLLAEDAYSASNNDEDAYEVGARLQWSF